MKTFMPFLQCTLAFEANPMPNLCPPLRLKIKQLLAKQKLNAVWTIVYDEQTQRCTTRFIFHAQIPVLRFFNARYKYHSSD